MHYTSNNNRLNKPKIWHQHQTKTKKVIIINKVCKYHAVAGRKQQKFYQVPLFCSGGQYAHFIVKFIQFQ